MRVIYYGNYFTQKRMLEWSANMHQHRHQVVYFYASSFCFLDCLFPLKAFKPGGSALVNSWWICAAGHTGPIPHYSLFCGQLQTPSWSLLGKFKFCDPKLVTFCFTENNLHVILTSVDDNNADRNTDISVDFPVGYCATV